MTPLTIPLSSVDVSDRVRELYDDIDLLADSIATVGLIQPLVLDTTHNGTYKLLAGGRRYHALKQLGVEVLHHGITCDPLRPGFIFTNETLDPAIAREVELMENLQRKDFTWQEVVTNVCSMHDLYKRRAVLARKPWTQTDTAHRIGYERVFVTNCQTLLPYLKDERFLSCTGITDALRLYYEIGERRIQEAITAATLKSIQQAPKDETEASSEWHPVIGGPTPGPQEGYVAHPCHECGGHGRFTPEGPCPCCANTGYEPEPATVIELSRLVHCADFRDLISKWPDACVDHIITDPPYAIDMDNIEQDHQGSDVSAVRATHDVEENILLLTDTIDKAPRLLRPGGFLVMWCDMTQWKYLHDRCLLVGLAVQRWPLVWHKTTPCKNSCAHYNTTKDYEVALVARKPNAALPRPFNTSMLVGPNDADRSIHLFAKPEWLWTKLFDIFTTPTQTIFDPFAGSGSCAMAGVKANRVVLSCEKEKHHYNYLVDNIKQAYEEYLQKVRFV